MEQYTFDGTIEEVNYIKKERPVNHKRLTIKQKYRLKYGINENVRCKDCKFCILQNGNIRHWYKCEKMGISGSQATDIRLKDYGCSNFIERGVIDG